MAALNPLTRELLFKIVFYGPGLGGKTTTLQHIHAVTPAESRGKLVSLATPTDRTLYFDFLPLRLGKIRNMGIRLQLFTVPGQVYYSATRKLVLTGADGIVFVADSQSARADANQESLEDLNANLAEHGRSLSQIAHSFQWNKRDLPDIVSAEELDRRFNLFSAPSIGTAATRGDGIFEGLEQITRLVLDAYRAELPKGDGDMLSLLAVDEGGIADAVRGLAERRSAPAQHTAAQPAGRPTQIGPAAPPPVPAQGPPAGEAPPSEPTDEHAALAEPGGARFSLAGLFRGHEQEVAARVEELLAAGDAQGALSACEVLLARVLAAAGGLVGPIDAPRDPGVVCLLLGLDGRRYLAMRGAVRAGRLAPDDAAAPRLRDASAAYTFCLEAARARDAAVSG